MHVFGDQRRVLVDRIGNSLLDRGSEIAVPLGAIGLQLRLVGHRPDQGMTEREFGARGEPHLIDQFVGN